MMKTPEVSKRKNGDGHAVTVAHYLPLLLSTNVEMHVDVKVRIWEL